MDVAALSQRLNKPLTARLMPIPGLSAGEMTAYDFAFFQNGTVMDFPVEAVTGLIEKSGWAEIQKRPDWS